MMAMGRTMNLFSRLLCVAIVTLAGAQASAEDAPEAITVYAAASLKESLDAIATQWQRQSQQQVKISYAATSVLATQIERGAPADVFISADMEWMDYLQKLDLIQNASRHDLLRNRLVLVVPADSGTSAFDLHSADAWLNVLQDGRLSLAETISVPAGRYAREALVALGVWAALESRLAQSDNVRSALAFVALGEAPLGIVYTTDARAEPKVRVLQDVPASLHAPIIYPVAQVRAADAARSSAFLEFLRSESAQLIFAIAGFDVPTPAR
jgi:molybdate transport system substrate-binding protein